MFSERLDEAARAAAQPLLEGMGFALVELSIGRLKGSTRVSMIVFRRAGVGVDDCGEISRLLLPRLSTVEGLEDLSLEVSSPGIERHIKSPVEYDIFRGRGVRILAENGSEWIGGIIESTENGTLYLSIGGVVRGFPMRAIRKARLDHTMEAKEKGHAI